MLKVQIVQTPGHFLVPLDVHRRVHTLHYYYFFGEEERGKKGGGGGGIGLMNTILFLQVYET